MSKHTLRDSEVIALTTFIAVYKRRWKDNLLNAWQTGSYGLSKDAHVIPTLQSLRNRIGPSGLQNLSAAEIQREYSLLLANQSEAQS